VIPEAAITYWRNIAPWPQDAQVEQDLILSRALVEIFQEPVLSKGLLLRGGTALHKLLVRPARRYSEDIDLVQAAPGPIGPILDAIRARLDPVLGAPRRERNPDNVTLRYRMESEIPPVTPLRLKVEINTREHFSVFGAHSLAFAVRSPCTEEVAVFHAFSRLVSAAAREVVIMDTAPTGHTLLLLDAAGAYHREVLRHAAEKSLRVTTPLMRLRDADYTKILLVTLAETTPVLEAAALAEDLRRAGIEPFAWIVNNSLVAAKPRDPLLVRRAAAERPQISKVRALARRVYVTPRLPVPPVGGAALRRLVQPASQRPAHATRVHIG
jgi:hypothetical protein